MFSLILVLNFEFQKITKEEVINSIPTNSIGSEEINPKFSKFTLPYVLPNLTHYKCDNYITYFPDI